MSDLSKRFERAVVSTHKKLISENRIMPQKVEEGILVGDVLIVNNDTLKDLYRNQILLYKDINLNSVAIKMANLLALRTSYNTVQELYRLDQEFGKWFTDSQILRASYEKTLKKQDYEKSDLLWARYIESRDRANIARSKVISLSQF